MVGFNPIDIEISLQFLWLLETNITYMTKLKFTYCFIPIVNAVFYPFSY